MSITAYLLARRYIGVKERKGAESHPLITWWLSLCKFGWQASDETPWCSAFVNGMAWELDLPRTDSAAARSWLAVGTPVALDDAIQGFDVVVLERGINPASGHVGFYDSHSRKTVSLLGGNQTDAVNVQAFDRTRVIGVRRLV